MKLPGKQSGGIMELWNLRKDFLELVENDELQKDKELQKKMLKMTINNFFDYLEENKIK